MKADSFCLFLNAYSLGSFPTVLPFVYDALNTGYPGADTTRSSPSSRRELELHKIVATSVRIALGLFLMAISLANALKFKRFSMDPASVTLVLVGAFICTLPLDALASRIQSLKVGSRGVELILEKLTEQVRLSPNQRMDLAGLSAHDIWALESFAKATIKTRIVEMTTPQRVAARTLVDLKLLDIVGEGLDRGVKVTPLGENLISAAKSIFT
jgi:hypothetical protein